ncbi:MAG: hypothetical protein JW990_21235 [Thermoleophilia bacterium]|nr:hypothetical protein [Thermoleophilia bacterium]
MADVQTYAALAWKVALMAAETLYGTWGTDGTVAARGDTAMGAEGVEARETTVNSQVTIAQTGDTLKCTFTMTCGATPQTIRECGVLTASEAGSLLLHSNLPTGIDMEEDDYIAFIMELQEL